MNRREFLKVTGAAGMLSVFNIVREFLGADRGRPGEVNTGLDFSIPLAKTLMLSNALAFAGAGTYSWTLEDLKLTSEQIEEVEARLAFAGIE